MNLVLDIESSAEFWRRVYPATRAPGPAPYTELVDCAHLERDVLRLAPDWVTSDFLEPLDGKLSVLTFDRALRKTTGTHSVRAWSGRLPEGSFYRCNGNVFVMSPGFMFLYAAHVLPFYKLVAFGDELCGLYGFDQAEKRGFRTRKVPLVTTSKLAHYLDGAIACYGRSQAEAALKHVIDRSASPMESFDEMAMCLPYRLGGYCMPELTMNHAVELGPRAARIARRRVCFADMCYPKTHIDIEYHGKFDHSLSEDMASDRARVNGLKEEGYEVIELTMQQVGDLFAFEYIILRIAKLIGRRIRREYLGAKPARLKFRNDVFAWNHSGGRIRF